MTPALRFRVMYERNLALSMGMSFIVLCPHKCIEVALIIGI